jgi:predicted nucleotidyltransferase
MGSLEIKKILKDKHSYLLEEFNVSRIGFFGSAARGAMTEDSDLDIIVEFAAPIGFKFNQLVEYLETLFGKKVDILTRDGVENIRVKEVSKSILSDITYV